MSAVDFPASTPRRELRLRVTDGQRFVDEPVYEEVRARPVAWGVHRAFIRTAPRELMLPALIRGELLGWRRVPLRWMKPDGNGALVPKFARDR